MSCGGLSDTEFPMRVQNVSPIVTSYNFCASIDLQPRIPCRKMLKKTEDGQCKHSLPQIKQTLIGLIVQRGIYCETTETYTNSTTAAKLIE